MKQLEPIPMTNISVWYVFAGIVSLGLGMVAFFVVGIISAVKLAFDDVLESGFNLIIVYFGTWAAVGLLVGCFGFISVTYLLKRGWLWIVASVAGALISGGISFVIAIVGANSGVSIDTNTPGILLIIAFPALGIPIMLMLQPLLSGLMQPQHTRYAYWFALHCLCLLWFAALIVLSSLSIIIAALVLVGGFLGYGWASAKILFTDESAFANPD